MFGVGWTELMVIAVVALLLFGPDELPVMMRRAGSTLRAMNRIRSDLMREVNAALNEIEREGSAPKARNEKRPGTGTEPPPEDD